jgi:hypothetical protein
MKKSKFLVLGLIALMLAGGLVLASCSACPGGGTMTGTSKGCTSSTGKECTDKCITAQMAEEMKKNPTSTAWKNKKYSCDC